MEEVWFLLLCGVGNLEAEEKALAQIHQALESCRRLGPGLHPE